MSGSLLLYALQSPINIGMLLRVAEVYQRTVLIVDEHRVFDREDARKTISDFSTGALQRQPPIFISSDDASNTQKRGVGRLIATTSSSDAVSAWGFDWRESDCLVLGNEYDGLPISFEQKADVLLTVPMPDGFLPKTPSFSPIDVARSKSVRNDGKPSLNVATAGAILSFLAYCSLSVSPASVAQPLSISRRAV